MLGRTSNDSDRLPTPLRRIPNVGKSSQRFEHLGMRLGALEYRTRRCRRCGPDADARLGSHFLGRGIQQPEWSGLHVEAVMEAVSIVAPVQQVIDPNDPLTLEQAEQRLNALLSQAELNAWGGQDQHALP